MTRTRVVFWFLIVCFSCYLFAQEWREISIRCENYPEKEEPFLPVYLSEDPWISVLFGISGMIKKQTHRNSGLYMYYPFLK
ncbi:MAG: hypothetical protein LUG18_02240 [Candidatus Azobacteroides sp.]|nr:hypothetical protein [Candidatus Azobacteroides sp.]